MPLFVCDKCECIDNTACGGTHWTRDTGWWPDEVAGKSLCSECAPTHFKDGSKHDGGGEWHGLFDKKKATQEYIDSHRSDFVYTGKF